MARTRGAIRVHLYCAEHQLVLAARCPVCYAVPLASTAWITSTLGPTRCPDFVDVLWENRYRQRCGASFLHVGQDPADPGDVEDQELLFTLASLAHTDPTAVTQACGISGQALTVYEAALEIITHLSGRLDLHVDADSQDHLAYGCRVAARFLTAP